MEDYFLGEILLNFKNMLHPTFRKKSRTKLYNLSGFSREYSLYNFDEDDYKERLMQHICTENSMKYPFFWVDFGKK